MLPKYLMITEGVKITNMDNMDGHLYSNWNKSLWEQILRDPIQLVLEGNEIRIWKSKKYSVLLDNYYKNKEIWDYRNFADYKILLMNGSFYKKIYH